MTGAPVPGPAAKPPTETDGASTRWAEPVDTGPIARRDRVVCCWVIGATFSLFGDSVFEVALAWTSVRTYGAAMAGLIVSIGMVPQAILMIFGGVLADRLDSRRIMIIGEMGRVLILVAALGCWQSGLHTAALMIMIQLLFGIVAGLSGPARSTMIRQLVHTDDLVSVSGWIQIGSRAAGLAGAPAGAVVVAALGFGTAMLIDAVTFLAIAILLLTVIRVRYRLPRSTGQTLLVDLRSSFRYLADNPRQRVLTLGICSLNVFISPVVAVGVSLRVSQSHWTAAWVGVAEASLAAGAIVGSAIAIRWQGTLLAARGFWALVLQGLGLALVGVAARPVLVIGMVLVGLTAGSGSVWISGVFQREIDAGHLGRVSSLNRLGDLVITPLMTPLFGLLAAHGGVLTATIAYGLAMAAFCLFIASRRQIRTLL